MSDTARTHLQTTIVDDGSIARAADSFAVTTALPNLPHWRVCQRCGHLWRSRSRGIRFRCRACEERARTDARAAAVAYGGPEVGPRGESQR